MSLVARFLVAFSLVSSSVSVAQSFAKPPPRAGVAQAVTQNVVSRASVRAELAAARAKNLAAFRAYVAGGVYPANSFDGRQLNVWRDRDGHYCAAATIIRRSGQAKLVEKVGDEQNFIRLASVTSGPLMDWILHSGFTQAEIAMIQEPFMPVGDEASRTAETARLRARYAEVDKALVANADANLDAATDRLLGTMVTMN